MKTKRGGWLVVLALLTSAAFTGCQSARETYPAYVAPDLRTGELKSEPIQRETAYVSTGAAASTPMEGASIAREPYRPYVAPSSSYQSRAAGGHCSSCR